MPKTSTKLAEDDVVIVPEATNEDYFRLTIEVLVPGRLLGTFMNVDFATRDQEIWSLLGHLAPSGQTELAESIFKTGPVQGKRIMLKSDVIGNMIAQFGNCNRENFSVFLERL